MAQNIRNIPNTELLNNTVCEFTIGEVMIPNLELAFVNWPLFKLKISSNEAEFKEISHHG